MVRWEESGNLTQSRAHPSSAPSTAAVLTEKKTHFEPQDLEWQASVTPWSKPAESHTRKAYWKAAGVWAHSGDVLLPRDPLVQGNQARWRGEKSAKPTVFGQEQGSITRVYHVIRPQQGKKKQERKLSRGDTHLRTPLWAMSSEAQRDKGKKGSEKRINQWLKPTK